MYLFEQLASPREFQTLNIHFPTFWLFLLCIFCSHSQGSKKLGSELRCGQTKDFLQLAAYSVQGSGTDFRCLGKPSVALEAMKLGWERSAFWPLCFQLERPLRKPISQHFLQNCLHPSHLVFSSDGGLPETSLKLRKELPDVPTERHGWLVCSRWTRNACFMPAVNGQGTWAWGLSLGTNVSSLGGETDGLSHFYQERRSWNAEGCFWSMPTTHQTLLQKSQNKSQQLLAKNLDVIGLRWNSNLKSVQKKKRSLMMPWKMLKGNGGALRAEKGRQQGSQGEALVLGGTVWGTGAFISPCPRFIKARGGAEQRHGVLFVCFFIIFFSSVFPLNQSLRVARWQCPLPSFHLACSPDLSLFLRPHGFGSLSSFLRNDYLQTCYVKSYDIAHHPQALSNGPPWKILVNTRQGPSGLMFVLSYYHKMSRKEPPGILPCGTPEKKRQGEIWMWNSHTFQLLSILRE